ncbi:MAG: PQQ-dependent sugar dehydrogenase [Ardenticatenales bacterium]
MRFAAAARLALAACALAAGGCRVAPTLPAPDVAPARGTAPFGAAAADRTTPDASGEGATAGVPPEGVGSTAASPQAVATATAMRSPDADTFDPNETFVTLAPVATGLDEPVYAIHDGVDAVRLYVVEKKGRIRIVDVTSGALADEPFVDLTDEVNSGDSERGLLSVAFHPDYAANRRLFVDYTRRDGAVVVAELTASEDRSRAEASTERPLLVVDQPAANHNGGQLAFGPDGALYVGLGDGGGSGAGDNAQARDGLLGKVLRLDVDAADGAYRVPADNPFVDGPYRPEVWAIGLRNPWRFSFDRLTGDLFIADVGDSHWEEVDVQPASSAGGENYGWPELEGGHCHDGAEACDFADRTVRPLADYAHEDGNCAVSGGFVYRGVHEPGLWGIYFYGDYCSGRIWGLWRHGGATHNEILSDTDHAISGFGEDLAGEVYVLDMGAGTVWLLAADGP